MSYNKNYWTEGQTITAQAMNHIERGIEEISLRKEEIKNKINEINSSSDDTQYPTAKAVWNLFHTVQDGNEMQF